MSSSLIPLIGFPDGGTTRDELERVLGDDLDLALGDALHACVCKDCIYVSLWHAVSVCWPSVTAFRN